MGIEIAIRSIQHYMYCPHRWGLLEIDRAWAENVFVTKANLLHERVHDSDNAYSMRGCKTFTSVSVYNDSEDYNLYGVTDCIELKEKKNGAALPGLNGNYEVHIIEYKPTKPKYEDYNYDDLMQVFAQKVCVDSMFHCKCDGYLYYADTKKRVKLPLNENFTSYDFELKKTLSEMRAFLKQSKIPTINREQKCTGCSLKEICMPSHRKYKDVRTQIEEIKSEVSI